MLAALSQSVNATPGATPEIARSSALVAIQFMPFSIRFPGTMMSVSPALEHAMNAANPILQPIIALVIWSLVIWLWMYVTRLPAMQAMNIKLDPNLPPGELTLTLPARVRWKADNYNHLMEQPTIFYAAALVVALADPGNSTALMAAWIYVLLRVAHSLVQVLVNVIMVRFSLFVMSTLALAVLVYQGARAVFAH